MDLIYMICGLVAIVCSFFIRTSDKSFNNSTIKDIIFWILLIFGFVLCIVGRQIMVRNLG